MTKSKLFTKSFILIFFANCFVSLTFYLLMTTLAAYAIRQFQASESMAGLASGIFIIGALFARLFTGKYMEVIGRKKVIYGSLVLFLIAALLYFPVNHLNLLLFVRFIQGVAFGASTTAMITAVMDMIPNSRRGEGTGYFALSTTIATAVGPFLGLFLTQYADYHMIFVTCTAFSVLSLLIILFAEIPEADITDEQLESMKKGVRLQDFLEKRAVPISVILIIMGISYSSIVSFINLYAVEIQLEEAASLFFLVYAVFLFISRPIAGRLQDNKGDNFIMYPAILLFSLCLLLIGVAQNGFILLLAGILLAAGYGTIVSAAQAIAIKESPKHRVGLATSTFFIFMDGGMGLGPFIIGMIVPYVGYRGIYLTLAVVVFLSLTLYYFLHGKKVTARKHDKQVA
ncbi:MFS transporter [Oceanobacillus senegalensis]|uniref:MFS transporter n=1 Tax=Oceanobacillus senegalensis TaxID=1936063 RepID=UPI000A308CB7